MHHRINESCSRLDDTWICKSWHRVIVWLWPGTRDTSSDGETCTVHSMQEQRRMSRPSDTAKWMGLYYDVLAMRIMEIFRDNIACLLRTSKEFMISFMDCVVTFYCFSFLVSCCTCQMTLPERAVLLEYLIARHKINLPRAIGHGICRSLGLWVH